MLYTGIYTYADHAFGSNPGVAFTPGAGNWTINAVCMGLAPNSEVKVISVLVPGSTTYYLRLNAPIFCPQRLGTAPQFTSYPPDGLTDGTLFVLYGTEERDILSLYSPNPTLAELTWDGVAHAIDDSVYRYIAVPQYLAAIGELNYHLVIEETGAVNAAEWEIRGVQLDSVVATTIQGEDTIITSTIVAGGGCAAGQRVIETGRLNYYPVYRIMLNGTGAAGTSSAHIRIGP